MENQDWAETGDTPSASPKGAPSWARGMVRIDLSGAIARLLLDRPDKLNAMDRQFWPDLRAGLDWIATQDARAIVMTGAGKRAFSVGGDIASFAALTTDVARREFQVDAMATFEAVASCTIPTIAAVNGLALGGGCEIAMACDFVLAARSATLGMPEARFGLVPGYGVLAAPPIMGLQMSKLMILTGEHLSAEDALVCGLVQRLCDDGELMAEAMRLAGKIASASPEAIAAGKALLNRPIEPEAVEASIRTISNLHATAESRAAVARFLK